MRTLFLTLTLTLTLGFSAGGPVELQLLRRHTLTEKTTFSKQSSRPDVTRSNSKDEEADLSKCVLLKLMLILDFQ